MGTTEIMGDAEYISMENAQKWHDLEMARREKYAKAKQLIFCSKLFVETETLSRAAKELQGETAEVIRHHLRKLRDEVLTELDEAAAYVTGEKAEG